MPERAWPRRDRLRATPLLSRRRNRAALRASARCRTRDRERELPGLTRAVRRRRHLAGATTQPDLRRIARPGTHSPCAPHDTLMTTSPRVPPTATTGALRATSLRTLADART